MVAATILICEDEPELRELMRISLDGDYSFAEADNATDAISLARRMHPDVILLDVMMPGQSGFAVIEELRGDPELQNVRIVVISAFATEEDRLTAQEAGADSFLAKPFDPEELETLVRDLLARRD
jgi:DNA-binding response OmpR family regulator